MTDLKTKELPCLSTSQLKAVIDLPPEQRRAYVDQLLAEGKAFTMTVPENDPRLVSLP